MITSESLFDKNKEIEILHEGQVYVLKITKQNKLLLIKK
ncbi:MAG: Hemin uptake protein hemP [Pseudomonadota bacterium]